MKTNIIPEYWTKGNKWVEYQCYNILTKVVFDDDKEDTVTVSVIAEHNYRAMEIARDWLLSRKAFLVKEILGQEQLNNIRPTPCSSLLIQIGD